MNLSQLPLSHNVIDVSLSRAEQAALNDLILASVPHAATLEYASAMTASLIGLWLVASLAAVHVMKRLNPTQRRNRQDWLLCAIGLLLMAIASVPIAPWDNYAEGKSIPLPIGAIMIRTGFFSGKESTATIYVNPADMPRLLPMGESSHG